MYKDLGFPYLMNKTPQSQQYKFFSSSFCNFLKKNRYQQSFHEVFSILPSLSLGGIRREAHTSLVMKSTRRCKKCRLIIYMWPAINLNLRTMTCSVNIVFFRNMEEILMQDFLTFVSKVNPYS